MPVRAMKIALVNWPINDVGGINTWCINFQKGLRDLGYRIQHFYATHQQRFACRPDQDQVKKRFTLLAGEHLSYHPAELKKTIQRLNEFDLIIFIHASPHPVKGFTSCPHHLNWKQLYAGTQPFKAVVFHDAKWHKTNPWFVDVAQHVDLCIAAQRLFMEQMEQYPCPRKIWECFPLDLESRGHLQIVPLNERIKRFIVATQWIGWKNHRKFLPHLPELDYPVDIYGNGIEYCFLQKDGTIEKYIGLDKVAGVKHDPKNPHVVHGYVPYDTVLQAMAQRPVSVDLSTRGYTNMSHWEPLTVGTLSVMTRQTYANEFNMIPRDCCEEFDLANAAEDLNGIMAKAARGGYKKTIDRAWKFIQTADCRAVARRILTEIRKS